MSKISFEDFDLVKFKVVDKSAHIAFYNLSDSNLDKQEADIKNKLHDDLKNAVQVLQELMAKRLGLLAVTDKLREEFKKDSKVLEWAMKMHQTQVERCKVSGITYSGNDDKKCVQITGSMEGDNYGSVGLATPITRLMDEVLGYEGEIKEACERIREEVYKHAFKGKKAPEPKDDQTSILDADQQEQGSLKDAIPA